jgi:hypothetical protein
MFMIVSLRTKEPDDDVWRDDPGESGTANAHARVELAWAEERSRPRRPKLEAARH